MIIFINLKGGHDMPLDNQKIRGQFSLLAWNSSNDYDYVCLTTLWKGKKKSNSPSEKITVMWSHENSYGVIGSKVGDFIDVYLRTDEHEGIFVRRKIAIDLIECFTGLKICEVEFIENPKAKFLSKDKPRIKRAKWLPNEEVDIVLLYSNNYIINETDQIKTDFFTVKRISTGDNWFMCDENTATKLMKKGYSQLLIEQSDIPL